MIAAIAYFSMAANLGWTGIQVEFERSDPKVHGNIRQIFYVRYIDCKFSLPALMIRLSSNNCRGPHYASAASGSFLDLWATDANYLLHHFGQRDCDCNWSCWCLSQEHLQVGILHIRLRCLPLCRLDDCVRGS